MSGKTDQVGEELRSDEALMTAVRDGDSFAFETLVLRHQRMVWSVAFRFLGDAIEAEDVAQEAFLRILQAAPRYEVVAKFRSYLLGIVSRLCNDRVAKKRPAYVQDLPDPADGQEPPLALMTESECRVDVRRALANLPPNQRMAIILRYYGDMTYAEIAVMLETTPKAVERLLARGRALLQAALRPLLE
jgi:RNA polymerase sigma-70 factor (ECF subfamily)